MKGVKVEYRAQVLADLRGLSSSMRQSAAAHMRSIERDPLTMLSNRHALPPMFAPGTIDAVFGSIAVRYCVRRGESEMTVIFLRVRLR